MEKLNKCVCGKCFNTNRQLSAHQASCREFYIDRDGNDKIYVERLRKISDSKKHKQELKLKERIDDWNSNDRYCETCGKLLTDINGSWRFCSKNCANTHKHSAETKLKISEGLRHSPKASNHANEVHQKSIDNYLQNPKRCVICNKELPYEQRSRHTCSEDCLHKLESLNQIQAIKIKGGNHNKKGINGKCKYGTYHGIECDSSYELAFIIYCLDNNIDIFRNYDYFEYKINDTTHRYFPDFKLGDIYIEIKGYIDEVSIEKYNQVPMDKYIVLIHGNMMTKFLKYCITTYGNEFTKMYDEDKPHWKYQ